VKMQLQQTQTQAQTQIQTQAQTQAKSQAKYINSPETKIYSKSKSIYGLFEAKNNIVENDAALIVEGYTDVILLHQEGIKNVVASLGTALTTEQIAVIGRFTKNIIIIFDSDAAGMRASLRGMERLREYNEKLDLYHESNINMRVAVLEEGYDPADYIMRKGRENFLERLDKAVNIIDFTIDMILRKYDINNLNDKLRATDELLGFISTLSSKIVQEECIKKISEKLNLRESLLIEQLLKKSNKKSFKKTLDNKAGFEGIKQDEKAANPLKNIEIEALKILVNGLGDKFYELLDIGPEYFKFDDTRKIYEIIKETFIKNKSDNNQVNFPLEISSDKLEDEQLKALYNMITFSSVNYSDYNLACLEVYNNLKRIYITDRLEETKKKLKQFENFRKELIKKEGEQSAEKLEKVDNKIKELNLRLNKLENEQFKYK
ncbi:MAG: toprim domain-containing protein, partial [Actinobacteria bacterium]|nr:toprim domain-containing protein [Actinomycetota bacterium]